jgi:hypothetical protein
LVPLLHRLLDWCRISTILFLQDDQEVSGCTLLPDTCLLHQPVDSIFTVLWCAVCNQHFLPCQHRRLNQPHSIYNRTGVMKFLIDTLKCDVVSRLDKNTSRNFWFLFSRCFPSLQNMRSSLPTLPW